ncbi:MAG: hypothetical protein DRJ01_00430 [Bacteroidetes bacterium]|nr:MAG: hypothetical protein DRJ01_00430 [Bacteroidota bacterium]
MTFDDKEKLAKKIPENLGMYIPAGNRAVRDKLMELGSKLQIADTATKRELAIKYFLGKLNDINSKQRMGNPSDPGHKSDYITKIKGIVKKILVLYELPYESYQKISFNPIEDKWTYNEKIERSNFYNNKLKKSLKEHILFNV